MKKHYGGEDSREFWDMINSYDGELQATLYSMGVILQNVESDILRLMQVHINMHKDDDVD